MSATLFDAVFGALTIKQCTSADFNPGNNIVADYASAAVNPSAQFLMDGDPRARWSTFDLGTALAAVDEEAGLFVSGGTITIPWRVRANGGSFVSGGNNLAISATHGLLVPQSLSVSQGSQGQLDLEAILLSSDGFTTPVTSSPTATVSAPGYTASYSLGPTSINSTGVTGVVGFTVNYGITTELEPTDGAVWSDKVYITRVNPSIDLRFRNQALVNTYGPLFAAGTAIVVSLIRNADGGSRSALTSEHHITCALGGGIVDVQNMSAQGVAQAEPTIRFHGKALTILTGQALAS
jgi:hypothetical protein